MGISTGELSWPEVLSGEISLGTREVVVDLAEAEFIDTAIGGGVG